MISIRRSIVGRALASSALIAVLAGCEESSTPSSPQPPGQNRVLGVPFRAQQTQVWCWAASIEMIADYYGRPVEQCQILTLYLQSDCCTFPGFCAVPSGDIATIQRGLFAVTGLRSFHVPNAVSFEELRAEIDDGRPVILGYRGSFIGHVVVLYGYGADRTLLIHDPFYGAAFVVPYGQSFTYGGQLVWSDTILGISP